MFDWLWGLSLLEKGVVIGVVVVLVMSGIMGKNKGGQQRSSSTSQTPVKKEDGKG